TRTGVDDLSLLLLERFADLILGGQACGLRKERDISARRLHVLVRNRSAASLPRPPPAVEQTHVANTPITQKPPDAGCVLAGIIVINDDVAVLVDAQLADAFRPH